jgi:hypothetical protein
MVLVLPFIGRAQDPFPTPTPTPDPLAGVPVQVLDQQQVTVGAHTITYNRIAPPVFPAATPAPAPQATPTTKTTSRTSQAIPQRKTASRAPQNRTKKMTRSTQRDGGSGDSQQYQILSLSATVYDHQFTALRWYDGTAPGLQAYVNLDFSYFSDVSTLETAATEYDLIFALGNDTASSLSQAGQPLPDFSAVPAGHSGYQIVAGDPSTHPDAIAALNALCAYYDANSAQMIAAYNQQQAVNAAQQQWLQTHPPVQPNTVINFWPVKSNVYPVASH